MKNKNEDIAKVCEFCCYAVSMSVGDDMLCEKKGVVGKEFSCRHFVYDPLKRVPRRMPEISIPEELGEEL